MVMYHKCGGGGPGDYVPNVHATPYHDVPPQQLLDFHYRALGYGQEKSLAEIPRTGLSSDYVYREARRAQVALTGTKTQLWPGSAIDLPTSATSSQFTPEATRDAVLAAFRAGAEGVILSRKYSEMKLANLRGAGEAIKQAAA